jgi:hypothetical protein
MEAGRARGADSQRPSPQNDISRSCGPQTAAPGDAEPEESEVGREERRDDYYFFFAVLRTDRLRAGAAFFARFLVDFFFIAITGLLRFVVLRGSAWAPPRLVHYAQKINKPLPRSKNSNGKMDFAGRVAASLEPAAQPPRASNSAGGVRFTAR